MTTSSLWRKGFILHPHHSLTTEEVGVGTQGRNLGAGAEAAAWKNAAHRLAPPGLFCLRSYTVQDHLPTGDTTQGGRNLPQQSLIKMHRRPLWWRHFPN